MQGQNSIFSLRLDDVSDVFDVEPKLVTGSSQVSIRVANATLDYENPNQRKFIVLVIAEETKTKEKLSSTATLTVTVTDANDNRPIFDQESYSFSVSETAPSGYRIASITAKDQDSGRYGTSGIRYSLSGTGSELFVVDDVTGVISVANCPSSRTSAANANKLESAAFAATTGNDDDNNGGGDAGLRTKRQTIENEPSSDTNGKKVNLTIVSQTGLIDVGDAMTTENYYSYTSSSSDEEDTSAPIYHLENDYLLVTGEADEEYAGRHHPHLIPTISSGSSRDGDNHNNDDDVNEDIIKAHMNMMAQDGPGKAPCLDYETQSVYFLSYKVCIQFIPFFFLLNQYEFILSMKSDVSI